MIETALYRLSRHLLSIALFASLLPDPAIAQLVAERINAANFASHRVGGPDADAGIDDWFLSNGVICAAISDPEHESPIAPKGGVLIDLGHCGRENDQWAVLQPMLNLSQSHVVPVSALSAGTTTGEAWIRTSALFAGVEMITTYSLSLTEPNALRVSTQAERVGEGDPLFSVGTILMHTSGQTRPFSLLRGNLEQSLGFRYPASDRHSLFSLVGALVAADLNILVGSEGMPPISYGIEQLGASVSYHEPGDARESEPLRTFAVTGLHYTAFSTLSQPAWFGTEVDPPSLLDLARIPFLDLDPKVSLRNDLRIWVGERSDVAAITDQLWPADRLVRGIVDDSDARIHIETEAGAPVTVVRPSDLGEFEFRLPQGAFRARARASAGREIESAFVVEGEESTQTLAPLEVGAPAWVRLPEDFLGRLIFLDAESGEPIVFGDDLLGFRIGDMPVASAHEAPFLNLAGTDEDPTRIAVPGGSYRVLAIRGLEYEIRKTTLEARPGELVTLEIQPLARRARTPGWIAADLHVHSGESFDSGLPATRQIAAFAASGAEVLIASEHDRIVDPRPAYLASGLTEELVAINGVEITSAFEGGDSPYSTGHWNAFPVAYHPKAYRGGAPTLEGRRARDAIADIRSLGTKPFLQLNHPRPGVNEGEGDTFFAHLGIAGSPYDPALPLTRRPNSLLTERSAEHGYRDVDYDGVELMNGPDLTRYRRVRADWFSLLLQGEARVATSNSDSHRLGVIVGVPRTYVETVNDSVDAFDEKTFMRALGEGRAYGTTGPQLSARLGEAGLGEIHSGNAGTLEVRVDAASWVPIAEWRAYVNGELVHRAPISPGQSAQLPLAFARDAFVTIEVQGPAEGDYATALPNFVPFAFTNPIFVDVDGNGRFDAPGLPDTLPTTLTDPDRAD
jgi:hypothetical protein